MKNRTFIVTLVCALVLSFGLAPASHAIIHPVIIALPLAAAFGAAGVGMKVRKAQKTDNHDQNTTAEQEVVQPTQPHFTGFGTAGAEAK